MSVVADELLGKVLSHVHPNELYDGEPSLSSLEDGELVNANVGGTKRLYGRIGDSLFYLDWTAATVDADFDFMDGTAFEFMDAVPYEFMNA